MTVCAVTDCTNNSWGRTYCGTHRDQKRKGFTPGQAPARYVDATAVRPMLVKLAENHSRIELGMMLDCSPRTVTNALRPDTLRVSQKLADAIRFASGEHFEPVEIIPRDKSGISGPAVAEYAKTRRGMDFIAKCRAPKVMRKAAA